MKTEQNESVNHKRKVFCGFIWKKFYKEKFYKFSNINSFRYYFWKYDITFLYKFVEMYSY